MARPAISALLLSALLQTALSAAAAPGPASPISMKIDPSEIVLGDDLIVRPGDQIVVA